MVRPVQHALGVVQLDPHARAGYRFHLRTQVLQQRLDLPERQLGVDRILKDGAQQIGVLLTHE